MARSRRLQQRLAAAQSKQDEPADEAADAVAPVEDDLAVPADDDMAMEYDDQAPPADDLAVDDDDIEIPEGAEDFDAQVMDDEPEDFDEALDEDASDDPQPARSSRRSSARSSARGSRAGRSARSSKKDKDSKRASKRKKKPAVDPAIARARRRAVLTFFLVILLLAVLGGGGYAAWYHFLRADRIEHILPACDIDNRPAQEVEWTRERLASWYFRRAREHRGRALQALNNDDHEAATIHIQQCREVYLNVEYLNHAQPNPSEENELIGNLDLAIQAHDMMVELDSFEARATRIRHRSLATRHFDALRVRFDRLTDIATMDGLDQLERDAQAFMRNPVDPQGVDDPQMAEAFSIMTSQIDTLMPRINAERTRRDRRETTEVVNRARTEITAYTDAAQYGKALSHIDTLIPQWPRAELRPLRQEIINAANQHFDSTILQARNAFARAEDAASTQADVQAAYQEGINALRVIIDNYNRGIPEPAPEMRRFISEAESMLRRYQR